MLEKKKEISLGVAIFWSILCYGIGFLIGFFGLN